MVNAHEALSSDRPRPSRATGDRGATTTELAVLMPAVIIVIMMIFQVAMFWHAKQAADVAAEEAVEAAQLATATAADGTAGSNTILGQAGNLRNATIDVDRNTATGIVTVTVTGDAPALIPFGSWTVSATAQGPIEQFISAVDP